MDFVTAVKTCLGRQYATFSGRARRSEFWFFSLFLTLLMAVAAVLDASLNATEGRGPVSAIAGLLTVIPALAVTVRRLHDIGRSGWWLLVTLVPLIGFVLLLIWEIRRGDAGDNRFGPSPLAAT